MLIRTKNDPINLAGLNGLFKKIFNYFSIFTIVLATTLGTINSANAGDYTLAEDGTSAANGINDSTDDDSLAAGDTVDLVTFTLTIDEALDLSLADLHAVTGTTGTLTFTSGATGGDVTQTLASFATTGAGNLNVTSEAGGDDNFTVTVSGVVTTVGGVVTLTADTTTAVATTLNIAGATIGGTGSSFVLDETATKGTSILNLNSTAATQTITGTIDGGAAGEGELQIANTGESTVVASAVGGTNSLRLLDVNSAASFSGAVTTTTATIDFATTVTGALSATTTTMGAGDVLTAASNVTSAIVLTDATSGLTLSGSDVTVTGDINAASATDAGIVSVTGSKVTFAGNLGAATGTNIDTLAVAASKRAVITETANFVDQVDIEALGELEITKAVTSGTVFTMTGATFAAADIASTSKIYLPVNLVGGETLIFAAGHSNADATATAIDTALVDTALVDYSAAQSGGTTTITATTKSDDTISTELGVTSNTSKAMVQALASVVNDTVADSDAEDAMYNAMTANGGYSATDDTNFAKQVAPQDDMISGSSVAAQAVTGSVQ